MSKNYIPGTASHAGLRSTQVRAVAPVLLRHAALVVLAAFVIMLILPAVLIAAGKSAGAPL